jgi:hypothetical protein
MQIETLTFNLHTFWITKFIFDENFRYKSKKLKIISSCGYFGTVPMWKIDNLEKSSIL